MIPSAIVTAWSVSHPWPSIEQVEQDLLITWSMAKIADDPFLNGTLALRGGTALHKLILPRPYRYSEDLDYVRITPGGAGDVMDALRELGVRLGFAVKTMPTRHPKVLWRYTSVLGSARRIKIEMNLDDRPPSANTVELPLSVRSEWYRGDAAVRTFGAEELLATKLRALYERRKGRDLFDLWLGLIQPEVDAERIVAHFDVYRPHGLTDERIRANLTAKLADTRFLDDCDTLILGGAESVGYDAAKAARLVTTKLLQRFQ